ncbi:MAG: phage tail sheath subtilisin-like domain-containing protein, partial [Gaiellaceae bacterium]
LSDGNAAHDSYVVVQSVTPAGLVTIASAPAIGAKLSLAVAAGSEPTAMSQEFRLVVTPPATSAAAAERIEPLSLEPTHPRNVLNAGVVASDWVEVVAPATPPGTTAYPGALAQTASGAALTGGQDDQPQALTSVDFQGGLDTLRDVDDVNLVVVPDAASHAERQTIQEAMIDHCLAMADRFAILDSAPGAPPYGPGSVEEQRSQVTADRGFAALYYPWLIVRDPLSSGPLPRTMTVPPSGAIAGVYARTDQERGVHKAPANTDVRGVLGLEQRLSDRLQGPLNLEGVNVLRIFPGNAQVIVWGARTTVEPDVTDWLYVNVRRLLLYIEESIQEGIRWAVFEGNDLSLWQKLNRTISAFLTGVWRDGGLFGAKAEDAFQVRIDEALNPPSERALGRLHIEIQVAPVRPAEFIVVRIGLWDGGDDVSES